MPGYPPGLLSDSIMSGPSLSGIQAPPNGPENFGVARDVRAQRLCELSSRSNLTSMGFRRVLRVSMARADEAKV